MKININTKNLTLTTAIEEYIYNKIGSLDKFILSILREKSVSQAWVEISKTTQHHKKGDYFETDVNLKIAGKDFRAESRSFDIRISIDEVRNELQDQLKSYRGKKFSKYLRGARLFKHLNKFSPLAWFRTKKGGRNREEGL